ncbi:hypothetical protein E2L06_01290 [Haloterrigena sp. H1]|uniref:hypothetical protein n=1 Tax=Haloterrigena sp. H1 TaxID=2552943 RepID=UPI00110D4F18|nr:hypothetical protein [Haloterrigena sp. H1]TMT85309.1 hypothetical protein E2L06_01290 [Haloterrigena sp. H1]
MSSALRLATLCVCAALVCAAVAGGPGTGALFSDTHVAAGNVSTDMDDMDDVSTVNVISEPETNETNKVEPETNETNTAEPKTNETD